MLVEDDNNLREIYGERLMAEGYEIVSAGDGEEALALAVKEKPDLIISDVMMPKISGFDMLDILRQTPETKFTKVIMMTALSQSEDKDRADRLGADKYLVKSQVTLEDVARVVHDLIYGNEEESATDTATSADPTPATMTAAAATVVSEPTVAPVAPVAQEPVAAPAEPVVATPPVAEPVAAEPVASVPPAAPSVPAQDPVVNPITGGTSAPAATSQQPLSAASVSDESAAITEQIDTFVAAEPVVATTTQAPLVEPSQQDLIHAQNAVEDPEVIKPELPSEPAANVPPVMPETNEELEPASARKKIIQPISDPTSPQPNINELYEQEMAREAANSPIANPQVVAAPAQLPDNPISNPAPSAAPALETADTNGIEGLTFTDQAAAAPVAPVAQPQVPAPEKEDKVPDPNDPASFAL